MELKFELTINQQVTTVIDAQLITVLGVNANDAIKTIDRVNANENNLNFFMI